MNIELGSTVYTARRVFCVGRNYAAHAAELDNPIPEAPVIFLKSPECLVAEGPELPVPRHGNDLHQEAEVVLLIGETESGRRAGWEAVAGVTLGLDLTLRDVQARLKRDGLPWELSKAFEASAPIGRFVPLSALANPDGIRFECRVNGLVRQSGDTALMLFPVPRLLAALSDVWVLRPGDLVFTGTPAGVGPLRPGDHVEVASPEIGTFSWRVRTDQIDPSVGAK